MRKRKTGNGTLTRGVASSCVHPRKRIEGGRVSPALALSRARGYRELIRKNGRAEKWIPAMRYLRSTQPRRCLGISFMI